MFYGGLLRSLTRIGGLRVSAVAGCLLIASVTPTRANLVADPGFESCTSVGASPPPMWTGTAGCTGSIVHSGSWAAAMGPRGPALSQSIATTAGAMYEFSFWLDNNSTSGLPNSFTASFGSATVLNVTNASQFPYTFEDFTVSAMAASTTISFATLGDDSNFFLDDVSVTPVTAAVPEPPPLPGIAAALGLVYLIRRASRRRHG